MSGSSPPPRPRPRPLRRAALCGLVVLCAAAPAVAQDALAPAVLQALRDADVPPEALAGVALPLGHHGRAWRRDATRPMQPGSSMKLLTSIVALERLGADHRGFTELRSAAPLDADGVLHGDLALVGGADPELSVPAFWALLLDLRQRGVRTIDGDLVLDRTRFVPARIDRGLPPFDEAPEFPYNVIPDALLLAGNLLPIELSAGTDGVRAESVPALPGIRFDSRMALSDARCEDWDDGWRPATIDRAEPPITVTLHGAFPRDCTQRVALQLVDRDVLAGQLFRSLWQGLGGQWRGAIREAAAAAGARVLARHDARPWGEVMRGMNKRSDNALTRLLFLELGAASPPPPGGDDTSTRRAGAAVRGWLEAQRIDTAGLVLDNGSGLSRSARVTPLQLASALRVAAAGPRAPDLLATLPVAGVDGTMRRRLRDSPAAGVARLKTGTLRNVVALAGIVADAEGRTWAVALMVNHDNAGRARPALDALIDGIARSGPHGPPPLAVGPLGDGP